MKPCKICNQDTNIVFNISFKPTPICESCASSIFIQQAQWYVKTINPKQKIEPWGRK